MASVSQTGLPLLEIACFNYESAINAARGGADQIELCHSYSSGGLSPDAEVLARLKSELSIPIYVMIRPHSQGFIYNDSDFEIMKATLLSLKQSGADGFVFGILNNDTATSWIDVSRCKELVALAGGKPCTFHRAFDCIPESAWDNALSDIVDCGFASILTNGGPSGDRAVGCIGPLAELVRRKIPSVQAHVRRGCRIPGIIVGGGVRSTHIDVLSRETDARFFHSSALTSTGEYVDVDEVKRMKMALNRLGS